LNPIKEALSRLKPKRLVVLSDGALQYLPFAVLRDPTAPAPLPLVTHYEIIHLPSASVLAVLRSREQEADSKPANEGAPSHPIAVIAGPVFQSQAETQPALPASSVLGRAAREVGLADLAPLPYTREEAAAILGMVPDHHGVSFLGYQANRNLVMSGKLAPYSILHFATHGLVSPAHPELSGLVLSLVDEQNRPQDGFLSLSDIYSLQLSARLVVLSACETGLGKELRGEGLMGLTRGFFYAGATNLVVSLWRVEDRSTAELMKRFYEQLFKKHSSPAAALRSAQVSMIGEDQWNDPYYWAGFILQGDWTAPVTSPDDSIEKPMVGTPPPDDYQDDDLPPPRPPARKKGGFG
jgi:CHAT domain-containing protein